MAKANKAPKDEKALAAVFGVAPKTPEIVDTFAIPQKGTAEKSIWSGSLSFGLVALKVKVYKATETGCIKLKQVDANTLQPVKTVKTSAAAAESGGPVEVVKTVKAYDHDGNFIPLTDEEIKACCPDNDETMAISAFVPAGSVDPLFFENTYYLAPDKGGERAFALLRAGMLSTGRFGVAHFTKAGRQTTAIIRPITLEGNVHGLALHYLFYDNEVRDFNGWNSVPSELNPEEVEMAGQLIEMYADDFNPKQYQDQYQVNLSSLIASKLNKKAAPKLVKNEAPKTEGDLLSLLAASVKRAKTQKKAA